MVILLSWPFQFWYILKAETAFNKYLFSSFSMIMVIVATVMAGLESKLGQSVLNSNAEMQYKLNVSQ
jgi:hypothetical protein